MIVSPVNTSRHRLFLRSPPPPLPPLFLLRLHHHQHLPHHLMTNKNTLQHIRIHAKFCTQHQVHSTHLLSGFSYMDYDASWPFSSAFRLCLFRVFDGLVQYEVLDTVPPPLSSFDVLSPPLEVDRSAPPLPYLHPSPHPCFSFFLPLFLSVRCLFDCCPNLYLWILSFFLLSFLFLLSPSSSVSTSYHHIMSYQ
ncbi:hypothetical protein SCHPADRAFT_710866 [Schizopora paradoxa]|uniref:Uncharacterized protein n=1 Tax=Schizopora paradoxa TaxID=27342 RepID=A0A0H2R240_9AGAM|nr:hypothetical protein SCHPADRAFT_710866 [Schizopora paradoxa]